MKCRWNHLDARESLEPVLLFSEIDKDRWETRKVYIWADGHCGYADAEVECGEVFLGSEPIPQLSEIERQPQFESTEITKEEFETVWAGRNGPLKHLL